MNDRQWMLTYDNPHSGSQRDRGRPILIPYGHDNLPRRGRELRRTPMRIRMVGVIGAAVALVLAVELLAILLLKR